MSDDETCGLCGRSPADGWAFDGDVRLCHGNARRTCYVRWTVYGQRAVDAVALTAEVERLRGADTIQREALIEIVDLIGFDALSWPISHAQERQHDIAVKALAAAHELTRKLPNDIQEPWS